MPGATVSPVVVDASALLEIFVGAHPAPGLRRRLCTADLAAPELVLVEALDMARRDRAAGTLTPATAEKLISWLTAAPVAMFPHRGLASRIWELRDAVPAADAAYLALAEQLDAPLVTCDASLADIGGHHATVEVYPTS